MTRRIYIGPDRVTVSKPGYDAVSPPAVTTDYLAVDSRFPSATRLYTSGFVIGVSAQTFFTNPVFYGTTFTSYPYVYCKPFSGNVERDWYQIWVGGNPDIYSNPFTMEVFTDRFRVGGASANTAFNTTARNWIYAVFAP